MLRSMRYKASSREGTQAVMEATPPAAAALGAEGGEEDAHGHRG